MSTAAVGVAQGGVCLVVWDRPQGWSVDAMLFHKKNVVSCKVVTNGKWNPIIGAYLLSYNLEHLLDLEEALTRLRDQYPIVLGDLSTDIGKSKNPHSQQVAELLI